MLHWGLSTADTLLASGNTLQFVPAGASGCRLRMSIFAVPNRIDASGSIVSPRLTKYDYPAAVRPSSIQRGAVVYREAGVGSITCSHRHRHLDRPVWLILARSPSRWAQVGALQAAAAWRGADLPRKWIIASLAQAVGRTETHALHHFGATRRTRRALEGIK
jgi:hypothetical protein